MDITKQYDVLVEAIIRPPRVEYTMEDMGSPNIRLGNRNFAREDFQLTNPRGLKFYCSLFAPTVRPAKLPCVIYCHGNSGCRLDAAEALRTLLPMNVMVAALDFSGCGMSEGEYISLGYYEKEDVNVLVNHLRERDVVTRIALWGRSMGAVTAVQCAQADPSLACIVADSPFSSLHTLAMELVQNADFNIPGLMLKLAFSLVRKSVKKRAKFDIKKLDIVKCAQEAFVPALFGHGDEDEFIAPSHTVTLQAAYAGDSNKVIFGGDHNSHRPPFFMSSVSIFFRNHLFVSSDFGADNPLPNKMTMEEYFTSIGGGDTMRIFVPENRQQRRGNGNGRVVGEEDMMEDSDGDEMEGRILAARSHSAAVTEDDLIAQAIAMSLQDQGNGGSGGGSGGNGGRSTTPSNASNGNHGKSSSPSNLRDEEDDPELAAALALSMAEAKSAGIVNPSPSPSPTANNNTNSNNTGNSSSSKKKDKEKRKSNQGTAVTTSLSVTYDASDTSSNTSGLSGDLSPASSPPLSPHKQKKGKKKDKKSTTNSTNSSSSSKSTTASLVPASTSSSSLLSQPPHPLNKAHTVHTMIDSQTVALDSDSDDDHDSPSPTSSSHPLHDLDQHDEQYKAAVTHSASTPPRTKKKKSKKDKS